jgi:hypothetical protein
MMAWVVLGIVLAVGCNVLPHKREAANDPAYTKQQPTPPPEQFVRYLNAEARKVQGLQAKVDMDCKADHNSVSLDGNLACSWPRNFRLKATLLGKDAADIGSNDNEFWFWISRQEPPYVYHCSHQDLASGKMGAKLDFPFQPDMVMAGLGLAIYDENKSYIVRASSQPQYLELVEDTISPQGKPVDKITVFNRRETNPAAGEPQVVAHVLKDKQGNVLAQAVVHRVSVSRETGAILPQHVTLSWPAQKMRMEMYFKGAHVVRFDPERAAVLFQRSSLSNLTSYDLGSGRVDSPGIQRAGGFR